MDSLALRYKLKILIQLDKNEEGNPFIITQLGSLLSQRNIFKTDKILENLNLLLTKFSYIFESGVLNTFKVPLVIYFYRRRWNTEIYIRGPQISHIFSKLMDERNSLIRSKKDIRLLIGDSLKEKTNMDLMDIFKANLIKSFFFTNEMNLYIFKLNMLSLPGLLYSLRHRPMLKRRKINFRRKLRYDSEGRVVNL